MSSIFKDAPIIPSKQMIVQQSTFWRARYVRLQGMERNEFPKLTRNGIPLHDDWFQTCLFLNLLLGTCNLRAFLCQRVETRAVPVFPIGWSCLCPSLRLGCCKQQWLAAARSQLICLHGVKVNFVQTLWLLAWGNPKKWTTEPLSWFYMYVVLYYMMIRLHRFGMFWVCMYFILQHNWGYEGLQDNFYKSYFEARGDGEEWWLFLCLWLWLFWFCFWFFLFPAILVMVGFLGSKKLAPNPAAISPYSPANAPQNGGSLLADCPQSWDSTDKATDAKPIL